MKFTALNLIRFSVPGVLLYVLLSSVCTVTHWCSLSLPEQWSELTKYTLSIVFSFFYAALPFRFWMNAIYFDAVNRNLVERLTDPFSHDPDVPRPLQWRHIRPIFYNLIDSDKSLSHQSLRAFASGALWTSAADLRAVALMGAIVFFVLSLFGGATADLFPSLHFSVHRSVVAMGICVLLVLISFPISSLITQNHIAIGNEQVDFIFAHYRSKLREGLTRVRI